MEAAVSSVPVTPEGILRELDALWVSLGKQQEGGEGGQGVLRACTLTLFVLADQSDDPAAIWQTMAAVMPEHPARAILIRFQSGSGREVNARVFAQCWLPSFGQRRQICCEQIEVSCADGALADLPPMVLPLAAPDLPIVVWCRCPRLFASPRLDAFAAPANKIIVDSGSFGNPSGAFGMLVSRLHPRQALADLAYTRITRWREALSRIFETAAWLERLPKAAEVRVEYSGAAPPPEAYYITAWLLDGIARAGGSARHRFEAVPGEPAGELYRVALSGIGLEASLCRAEHGCAEVRTGDIVQRSLTHRAADDAVLSEELGIPGRDPVFERTLTAAARLAVSSST
jgi:glucose-6-phosphate dehydrogenase assembly protein OpcA